MKNIWFLGECMAELRSTDNSTMHCSFAGDVYNSSVYLKRLFGDINTGMITALGKDSLSDKIRSAFESEDLDNGLVFTHPDKVPGLYLVEVDDQGERSFTYWRNDSAARQVATFFDLPALNKLCSADVLFFSGISLAVLTPETRDIFWHAIEQVRTAGVKLVFDPNYRARLWKSPEDAINQFNKAFQLSDIFLPGVEDLNELYGVQSTREAIDFCRNFNATEIVIKNGAESVLTLASGELEEHAITPVKNVVDTTSAGDAFNGGYLGARLSGHSVQEAVRIGAKASAVVIQHPGAIVPKQAFDQSNVIQILY
jgi:2-dehydro-3-deoxygluconokinase